MTTSPAAPASAEALTLLACQIDIPLMTTGEDRDAHIDRVACAIDISLNSKGGVDLVVLPELASLHYSEDCFNHLAVLAEYLEDSPTLRRLGEVAQKHSTSILAGLARHDSAGAYYISQVLIEPDGQYNRWYDKLHIAQFGDSMEKLFFRRGDHVLVFEIRGFTFGVIICYDMRIPELSRDLARRHQVDVLLHPTAFCRDETFFSWHDFAKTRALENQVYFASVNRAGADFGSSVLMKPWIDENTPPVVLSTGETFARWQLTRDAITDARAAYPFLKDLREDYSTF